MSIPEIPQPNPAGANQAFCIGDWIVNPALNQIQRASEIVHLEPKAIALLMLLAEQANTTLSRDELLAAVWPSVVVSDDALTQVVIKLRKALGDKPASPRYIQTIPKRGYRLVAAVSRLENEPASSGYASQANSHISAYQKRLPIMLIIALVVITLAGLSQLSFWKKGMSPEQNSTQANPATPEPLSIAILPFETLQEGRQQINFARGIRADLTTDLSKLSGLWVINVDTQPATPSNGDMPEANLPHYLVNGSVQRSVDHMQVYIRLIDSRNGHQLWSERFERPFSDLFTVQSEISKHIVDLLEIQVTAAEHQRMAARYTQNLEAYEYFLQAQENLLAREESQNNTARESYWQAVKHDPTFARAYAGLALSHVAEYRNQWGDDGMAALQRAQDMAETARQIDPNIPEVYWVLAYINAQQRQHDRAIPLLAQALDLDQSFADAYALMGGINTYIGDPEKSVQLLRDAMRLNPRAGYLYFLLLGRAYYFLNDSQQAEVNLREAISRNPENLEAHVYLAATALMDNKSDEAQWEAEEIRALDSEFSIQTWLATYPMTDKTQIKQLTTSLLSLGL